MSTAVNPTTLPAQIEPGSDVIEKSPSAGNAQLDPAITAALVNPNKTVVFLGSGSEYFVETYKSMAATFLAGTDANVVGIHATYIKSITQGSHLVGNGVKGVDSDYAKSVVSVGAFVQTNLAKFSSQIRYPYMLIQLRSKDGSTLNVVFVSSKKGGLMWGRGKLDSRLTKLAKLAKTEPTLIVLDLPIFLKYRLR